VEGLGLGVDGDSELDDIGRLTLVPDGLHVLLVVDSIFMTEGGISELGALGVVDDVVVDVVVVEEVTSTGGLGLDVGSWLELLTG